MVVEVAAHSGMVMTGVVVKAASEVLNIKGEGIEDMPSFGTNLDSEYILRMAKG